MSESRDCTPEERQKLIDAAKNGIVLSDEGKEYFARAGVINGKNPDFTIVSVKPQFWGQYRNGDFGNQGGVELRWQSVSAGWGSLTIYVGDDGKLHADTEAMGPNFCKSVLAKLVDDMIVD